MNEVAFLMEQYKTVRQESLDTLSHMQTINQWGLGSIGVSIGLGLVAAPHSAIAAAVILMGLVPMLIAFSDVEMAVMARRVVQARRFLRHLETTLAAQLSGLPPDFVGWEHTRANGFHVGGTGFRFAILATVGVALVIGPVLGGLLLAADGYWGAFAAGEAIDLIGLAVLATWATRTYSQLTLLNESELPPTAASDDEQRR